MPLPSRSKKPRLASSMGVSLDEDADMGHVRGPAQVTWPSGKQLLMGVIGLLRPFAPASMMLGAVVVVLNSLTSAGVVKDRRKRTGLNNCSQFFFFFFLLSASFVGTSTAPGGLDRNPTGKPGPILFCPVDHPQERWSFPRHSQVAYSKSPKYAKSPLAIVT